MIYELYVSSKSLWYHNENVDSEKLVYTHVIVKVKTIV